MASVYTVEYCVPDETTVAAVFSTQDAAVALWRSLPVDDGSGYGVTRKNCEVLEYPVLGAWTGPVPDRDSLYAPWPDHRTGRIVTPDGAAPAAQESTNG